MQEKEVLLHACCAPCSSAIVEWMQNNNIRPTIFYYNPNIWPREEYEIRKRESKRHAESLGIRWIDGDYDHASWLEGVSRCVATGAGCGESADYDMAQEPERGRRCEQCFRLRLTAAARKAVELGIPCFATTLASSRWKSLDQINRAGHAAECIVNAGSHFWPQNWRKGGLQERRNQLLKEFGFYNQQYCGCEFSARRLSTKELLRHRMRELKHQHAGQLARWSAEIVERLSDAITLHPSVVLAYWPLADEVDLRPLLDRLVESGTTVLLPRVTRETTMELRRYTSRADLCEGAFHIMEPTGELFTAYDQIGLALVPGVAFDSAGRRLGRGRGYYDRLLPRLTVARKVGVCFPFQRVAEVPAEAHDVLMDTVVS